ncbi:peptide/nickel transport system substrate-binding protein [Angulomicrobium tetraedrale]|uniref:Peptide/nickel transport system substrate-binding protein n=1 Tax=Ancylobacter tetraedralis TaxID=217068 RepID=A0A839Z529_9HYPH|nr:ABC transporter substrate-binding protein [Ancylobacter tetraedralis]MBB3769590.1 peptide/nickel transport system substrate-binding protein [Ancylobacter tetraedralis]
MSKLIGFVNKWRQGASELENGVVDQFLLGQLDRRAFFRHGSRIGLSAAVMAGVLQGAGFAPIGRAFAQGKSGGTIRVAQITPSGAIEPVSVADQGGLLPLALAGDFLALDGPDLVLRPMLATSWKPNEDGSVWTFTLRPGVKFHDGRTMTADDVVASIDRLADPANGSNALSAFKGVLSKGGTTKVDDLTVKFTLDAPNGNFPYYVSSDNYNAIILPADYKGDFEKNFNGTGPFKIETYTPKVGATFVRNPDYWAGPALADKVEISFYAEQQPQVLAVLGGQIDLVQQIVAQGSQSLFDNPAVKILRLKSNAHRQIHMKNKGAFADKRVRQAVALTLDRPAIIKGLFKGMADPGNDSPFAPVFPSTDTSVPQRVKDIAKAKELMAAAGAEKGFEVTLTTMQMQELPTIASLIRNSAGEIGIKVNLKIEDVGAYYGDAVPGKSDWLDSEFGITDYGHRGTPNVFLAAPLLSTGTWNSAEFKNPEYDKLVASYIAALDPAAQKAQAGAIQRLLLDETPVIFPYFYDYLTATSSKLTGVEGTAMGQMFLHKAGFV